MAKQSLSNKLFREKILRLEAAFRIKPIFQESLVIYYEKLKSFKDDDFTHAVEQIIDEEDFFPSIAKFKKFKSQGYSIPAPLTDEKLKELNE